MTQMNPKTVSVSVSRLPPWLLLCLFACAAGGCTIAYHPEQQSNLLKLYHNSPDGRAPEFDLQWAEAALRALCGDFDVPMEKFTPVEVYIDCREESGGSYFNRLTKTLTLSRGQEELPVLFIHELTHLLLDQIHSQPPYWVDQGLAEYMESRAYGAIFWPRIGLLPAFLDMPLVDLRAIAENREADLRDRVSREAVELGWSWAKPLIHYLISHRWREWPLSLRLRRLAELNDVDLVDIDPGFQEFCRDFNPVNEFLRDYREAPPEQRLLLRSGLLWRFPESYPQILGRLERE
jgi:hypothetical protein